jgi:arylsulfatase A-like enzyme
MSARPWAAAAALGLAACGAGGAKHASPRPDIVVLVSIDTLRADHLGCYGYTRNTSPTLDRLAAEGTLFEDAMTPAPWTLPAHASLLTGLYPSRHGVKAFGQSLPARVETLAQLLGRQGRITAAVVNSHLLGPRSALDRGFREFSYVEEVAPQREPTRRVVDQAISWLRRYRDEKLFLFVHSYDVHSDYKAEERYEREFARPYQGRADGTSRQLMAFREGKLPLGREDAPHLMDLYDAGIRQTDDEIARLVAALRSEGMLERTLLVITSDHGEEFFEHGGILHGRTQYQEVVRVPLLLRGPGIPKALRIATLASLLDVMPTLLASLGVAVPPGLDGENLLGLFASAPGSLGARVLFGEADHVNAQPDITRAVRRGSFKLVYDRLSDRRQLFDLARDPGESADVQGRQGPELAELDEQLRRFLAIRGESSAPAKLSPAEIEKLRSLGYIQ